MIYFSNCNVWKTTTFHFLKRLIKALIYWLIVISRNKFFFNFNILMKYYIKLSSRRQSKISFFTFCSLMKSFNQQENYLYAMLITNLLIPRYSAESNILVIAKVFASLSISFSFVYIRRDTITAAIATTFRLNSYSC